MIRIAQFSDLHYGRLTDYPTRRKPIKARSRIQAYSPDMINERGGYVVVTKSLLAVLLAASETQAGAQKPGQPEPSRLIEGSYIVMFKPSTERLQSPILPSLTKDQLRATAPVPFGEHSSGQSKEGLARVLGISGQVAAIFDAINASHLLIAATEAERLKSDPRVLLIEQNKTTTMMQTVQTNPGWALDRLDQPLPPLNNQYVYNSSGAGQTIYILDGGLTLSVPAVAAEFGGRATIIWDVNMPNGGPGMGQDCFGHGTPVASAAAGATYGVAKSANLVIAKITTGCTNESTSVALVTAFNWLATNVPRGTIVNYSGSFYAPLLNCNVTNIVASVEAAIRAAFNAGVITVVSAGNDGCDTANYTPARMFEVFAVGATSSNRLFANQDARAGFSRTGRNISAFAPGQAVDTLSFSGTPTLSSGTSYSAPYMAGMFAVGCQWLTRPANAGNANCQTPPNFFSGEPNPGTFYRMFRDIAQLSVVNNDGSSLPGNTVPRFVSRSPW